MWNKKLFINFKGHSGATNCLRPEGASFKGFIFHCGPAIEPRVNLFMCILSKALVKNYKIQEQKLSSWSLFIKNYI